MQVSIVARRVAAGIERLIQFTLSLLIAPAAVPMTSYYILHLFNVHLPNNWSANDMFIATGILYVADIPLFAFLANLNASLKVYVTLGSIANLPIWFVAMIGAFSAASNVDYTPLNPQFTLLPVMAVSGGLSGWIFFRLLNSAGPFGRTSEGNPEATIKIHQ